MRRASIARSRVARFQIKVLLRVTAFRPRIVEFGCLQLAERCYVASSSDKRRSAVSLDQTFDRRRLTGRSWPLEAFGI